MRLRLEVDPASACTVRNPASYLSQAKASATFKLGERLPILTIDKPNVLT
jgi:hypothetical protein